MDPTLAITITPPEHVDAPPLRLQRVAKSYNLVLMGRAVRPASDAAAEVAETCRRDDAAYAKRMQTQEYVTYKGVQ